MKRYRSLFITILAVLISNIGIYIFLTMNMNNKEETYIENQEKDLPVLAEKVNDKIVLKIAHSFPESHPQHIALVEKFLPMVEKGSEWNIRVEVYPNGQLGGDQEYIQGVRNGIVEMCIGGVQTLAEIWPKLNVLEFPYIFDNYDQAAKILNGPVGANITEGIEKLGIHSLVWSLNGFHQISTNGKLLISGRRQENIKIGTIFSKINVDILESMGFTALTIRTDGIAQASRQNVADGYDNLPLINYYNLWDQSQKHLYMTNHMLSPAMFMVSSKIWDTLPDNYKKLIQEAAKVSAYYEIELLKNDEKDIFESLEKKKASIEYPDLSKYKSGASSVYQKWIKNDADLKLVFDQITNETSSQ